MTQSALTPTLSAILHSAAESLFPDREFVDDLSIHSKNGEGDTPLHVMAWRGDVASAKVLLAAGADPDAQGDMDETPLHVAIRMQNEALVLLLLAVGAQTNLGSEFGETAFEMARAAGGNIANMLRNRSSRRRVRDRG